MVYLLVILDFKEFGNILRGLQSEELSPQFVVASH
jgi:hypothetical protein